MKSCKFFVLLLLITSSLPAWAQKKANTKSKSYDTLITITTQFGEMTLILYENTPKHRANFIKLVKDGFYKDLLFHRVIKEFMIQGGDPDSKNAPADKMLGAGGVPYRIDAEFNPQLFHKKGALAAARDNNPQKASSGCQFYIVQGKKQTDADLRSVSQRTNTKYSPAQVEVYHTAGGTPQLDQNYTVFGEVIKGLEVIDTIANQPTGRADRPTKDIQMNISYKRMKKKDITKKFGYQYPEEK